HQRQESKERRERPQQHAALECDRNERRRRQKRSASHDDRVVDAVAPPLHEEPERRAGKTEDAHDQRNFRLAEPECLREPWHRTRRVRIEVLVAALAHVARRIEQLLRRAKFAEHPRARRKLLHEAASLAPASACSSSTSSWRSSLSSLTGIAGRRR